MIVRRQRTSSPSAAIPRPPGLFYEANLGLKGPLKIVEFFLNGTFAKIVKKAGEGLEQKLNAL